MTRKHEEIGTEEEVVVEESEVEETEFDESTDEGESEDVPLWMAEEDELESSEEDEDDEDDEEVKGESVPVPTYVKNKKKWKGKLSERDAKIAELERKLAEKPEPQEQSQQPLQPELLEPPQMPLPEDSETDEEHRQAMVKYSHDFANYVARQSQVVAGQSQQVEQRKQQIQNALKGHDERSKKLIDKHGISPEVFKQAEANIRDIVKDTYGEERVNAVMADLIDSLGEESGMVAFHVGRNKSKRLELADLLRRDPSGVKAVAFLNRIAGQVSTPKNQSSRAPKPPANASGESTTNAKESALKKKWNEAHKKGNADEARKFKKQAKVNGFDTSTWR